MMYCYSVSIFEHHPVRGIRCLGAPLRYIPNSKLCCGHFRKVLSASRCSHVDIVPRNTYATQGVTVRDGKNEPVSKGTPA